MNQIKYSKAVGPKLYKLLMVVFSLVALLVINSLYLGSITFIEWYAHFQLQNQFYLWMFFLHLLLGILLLLPLIIYGIIHIKNTKNYRNKTAVRAGYLLFLSALILLFSGMFLTQGIPALELNNQQLRMTLYIAHVVMPIVVLWLFVLHRLAGRKMDFSMSKWVLVSALAFVLVYVLNLLMVEERPKHSTDQFEPSFAMTEKAEYIEAEKLNDSDFCQDCHADSHEDWLSSAHRLSSFNNEAYAFSINQTKASLTQRMGHSDEARFCAACHDPVLFFSGQFDDLTLEQQKSSDAMAGITCSACHTITAINSVKGNGAYTIAEAIPYPFDENSRFSQPWLNQLLIKSKPSHHKKTYLKPLHSTTEFCSTCHKVSLPESLNQYKWLRGQNHYDSFWLSGVSGHNVASFYYPPKAKENCAECHMPLKASDDFGAKYNAVIDDDVIHDHRFSVANTAIRFMNGFPNTPESLTLLKDSVEVDIFAIKEQANINSQIIDVFNDQVITVQAGSSYLIETLLKTIKLGHAFTQGTADSNQIWLEFNVYFDDQLVAQSGGINDQGEVDTNVYYANAYVIDKTGKQIKERNAEDIFTTLYNHQIPPGAASVTHYQLDIPSGFEGSIQLEAKLHYRKFNSHFYRAFKGDQSLINNLPTVMISSDKVELKVGSNHVSSQPAPDEWRRWNDYGIALLRSGALKQAELAFRQVATLGRGEGWVNLSRLYIQQGQLEEARETLSKAAEVLDYPYQWHLNYFSGKIHFLNGNIRAALDDYQKVLSNQYVYAINGGFDFSADYQFLIEVAETYFQLSRIETSEQAKWLTHSAETYHKVLEYDPEKADAYYGLAQIAQLTGSSAEYQQYHDLYQKYKEDDQAKSYAISVARMNDAAADKAANQLVIYPLLPVQEYMTFDQFAQTQADIEYL